MDDHSETGPLPVAKTQPAGQTVRFAEQPQAFELRPELTEDDQAVVASLPPVRTQAGMRTTRFALDAPEGLTRNLREPVESRQPPQPMKQKKSLRLVQRTETLAFVPLPAALTALAAPIMEQCPSAQALTL